VSILATVVLLINVTATAVHYMVYRNSIIFTGDCQTAYRLSSCLHVLLNLLASMLLGASNLCMQLLAALKVALDLQIVSWGTISSRI
jgi:hypothetical protein